MSESPQWILFIPPSCSKSVLDLSLKRCILQSPLSPCLAECACTGSAICDDVFIVAPLTEGLDFAVDLKQVLKQYLDLGIDVPKFDCFLVRVSVGLAHRIPANLQMEVVDILDLTLIPDKVFLRRGPRSVFGVSQKN